MNFRNLAIWAVIVVGLIAIYVAMNGSRSANAPVPVTYSDLIKRIDEGQIRQVKVHGQSIEAIDKTNHRLTATGPLSTDDLQKHMADHVPVYDFDTPGQSMLVSILLQ